MSKWKRIISLIFAFIFIFSNISIANGNITADFIDVPRGHWADKVIHDLRSLNITNGIGDNKFGIGQTIKRSEFVTFLVKLMNWEVVSTASGSFADNMDIEKWYYAPIETALKNGIITKGTNKFRVDEPITREEMAIMIVRTLGYDNLAKQINYLDKPFSDVSQNIGYITIAKDLGIINGVGNNSFKPYSTAKREEAAAMMMRMYDKLNNPLDEVHAFYAIRSANQASFIPSLSSVGFGWSRLEYDAESKQVILNTDKANNNEYSIPSGFDGPINSAKKNNTSTQLMVFLKNDVIYNPATNSNISLAEYILTNASIRKQVIDSISSNIISKNVNGINVSFDGVVIDFEGMKGEFLKQSFNIFLKELNTELDKNNKSIYVAVHPKRSFGHSYYDGYDYKTIGQIADRVILMAHDYYAKQLTDYEMQTGYTSTPLTPTDELYYALKAITDKDTGVQELDKILLQISFDSAQWKLRDGKVINKYPYSPSYEAIQKRLLMNDVVINYSESSHNPYASFYDANDNTQNILWYEDSRSVQAKINLAKMFGIKGLSLWRLGNIPEYEDAGPKKIYLDTWQQILQNVE